jgi:photosystem II stability/assembly factor-like uncharacterized protein
MDVTLANDGQEITLNVGERFLLDLGDEYRWSVEVADQAILSRVVNITVIRGAQGVYEAHQAGTTTLSATGDPQCRQAQPPCGMPSRVFSITVAVIGGTPTPQASGEPLFLNSIHMFTATVGWATGEAQAGRALSVYRTQDGGGHWQDVTPLPIGEGQYGTASFLDESHAWVSVTSPGEASAGSASLVVYRTTDGGQSWEPGETLELSFEQPVPVDFVDPQRGWMMVSQGFAAGSEGVRILRSDDGGLHWGAVAVTSAVDEQSTSGSLPLGCGKLGLAFIGRDTGWVTGSCPGSHPVFFVTHDGGRSWERQGLTAPPGYPAGELEACRCALSEPIFSDPQHGALPVVVLDQNEAAYLYVTQDGGDSWEPRPLPPGLEIDSLDFAGPQDGWGSDGSRIFATQDGGQSWEAIGSLPAEQIQGAFSFVDGEHGWFTDGEHLYATRDGGMGWDKSLLRVQ